MKLYQIYIKRAAILNDMSKFYNLNIVARKKWIPIFDMRII